MSLLVLLHFSVLIFIESSLKETFGLSFSSGCSPTIHLGCEFPLNWINLNLLGKHHYCRAVPAEQPDIKHKVHFGFVKNMAFHKTNNNKKTITKLIYF